MMESKDASSKSNNSSLASSWAKVGTSHKTLQKTVTDALRKSILHGEFKPGDRLTEIHLAEMFNVSRNPIREALGVLHGEGIVDMEPRKGARVAQMSIEEIYELIELRAEMAGMSARYAAIRCSDEIKKAFDELLVRGERVLANNDLVMLKELNLEFHALLSDAGKNRFLANFTRSLNERPIWFFENAPDGRVIDTWKEHSAILLAVVAGDSQLSAALAVSHTKEAGRVIVENMEE